MFCTGHSGCLVFCVQEKPDTGQVRLTCLTGTITLESRVCHWNVSTISASRMLILRSFAFFHAVLERRMIWCGSISPKTNGSGINVSRRGWFKLLALPRAGGLTECPQDHIFSPYKCRERAIRSWLSECVHYWQWNSGFLLFSAALGRPIPDWAARICT